MNKNILCVTVFVCAVFAIFFATKNFNSTEDALSKKYSVHKNILATSTIQIESDITQTFKGNVFFAREVESFKRYKVTTPPRDSLMFGDCLLVSGLLSLPQIKSNSTPNETSTLYNFPYKKYLAKDSVYELLLVKHLGVVDTCPDITRYQKIELYFIKLKRQLTDIFLTQYEQPYAGFVAGVLVAGKGLLDKDSLELFKRTSLSHVVVLSGSNVSIILICIKMCVDWIFFWIKQESEMLEWIKKICVLGAVWCFVLLTGGGAPIYRAAVSAFCGLIVFRDATSQTYALTIVVLLMTIQSPFQTLYDPSFHLTCCATYGLILFSKPFDTKLRLSVFRHLPDWLREIISVTLATQVFVFPYIMYMTSSFSSVFLLSNIVVLPLIPVVMFLGFVTMITTLVSPFVNLVYITNVSVYINNIFLHIIFSTVQKLSQIPYAYIQVKKSISITILVTYALLFACITFLWNRKST